MTMLGAIPPRRQDRPTAGARVFPSVKFEAQAVGGEKAYVHLPVPDVPEKVSPQDDERSSQPAQAVRRVELQQPDGSPGRYTVLGRRAR
jgi:hypothetical protein